MYHSMRSPASGFLEHFDLNLRMSITVIKGADDPYAPCAGTASVAADLVSSLSTARSGADGGVSQSMMTSSHMRGERGADVFAGPYHSAGGAKVLTPMDSSFEGSMGSIPVPTRK